MVTCSVVLWGGRNTANKYHSCVGVLAVYGPHWVYPSSQQCVLSVSTPLRHQVALKGICPKQALGFVHFPGLSFSGSGSRVLHKDSVVCMRLCPSQVRAAQATRCLVSTLSQVGRESYHLPGPGRSRVHCKSTISGVPCVSSGEQMSGCDPPGRCQPASIPGRHD